MHSHPGLYQSTHRDNAVIQRRQHKLDGEQHLSTKTIYVLLLTLYNKKVSDHVDSVAEFERAIKSDADLVGLFNQAFLQASSQNQVSPNFELVRIWTN